MEFDVVQVDKQAQKKLVIQLLIGFAATVVAFGVAYFMIGFIPGSGLIFSGNSATFLECLYFSVVTVTTLGYGDVTPVGYARFAATGEAVFGLVYVGYAISQVVSFKQESLITYLANDRILQTYDLCLADISDAKEMIADRRRAIQAKLTINKEEYFFFRLNPFYPAFKSIRVLIGYTAHIESIGKANEMAERLGRAAHHVEEVAGFTRKLVNILINENIEWKTDRTVMLLSEICEAIDSFAVRFINHTKYADEPYKGGKLYKDVIFGTTTDIRQKISGPTIRYKKSTGSESSKLRRISRISTKNRTFGLSSGSIQTRGVREE